MKSPVPQKKKRWMSAQVRVLPTKKCPRWDSLFSSCPCTARCHDTGHVSRVTDQHGGEGLGGELHQLLPPVGRVPGLVLHTEIVRTSQCAKCTLFDTHGGVHCVLDHVDNLVHLGHLQAVAPGNADLSGQEPGGGWCQYKLYPDGDVNLQMVMDWQIFSPL